MFQEQTIDERNQSLAQLHFCTCNCHNVLGSGDNTSLTKCLILINEEVDTEMDNSGYISLQFQTNSPFKQTQKQLASTYGEYCTSEKRLRFVSLL